MGLGPPVCVDCGVIGYLSEGKGWRCPNCGDKPKSHLWLYPHREQEKFLVRTTIVRENKTDEFPDK